MSIRQNILLSSANKSIVTDLNNDITLSFPSNLFYKSPNYLELINFDLNCELITLGSSNNTMIVRYKNTLGINKSHTVVVTYTSDIKTDYDLAQAVKTALNAVSYDNYNITFDVQETSIVNVITNFKIEIDSSTTSYNILSTLPCTISFKHKDSIGPLMGFGSGIYENITQINGTSTQSISAYNFVDVFNNSGDTGIFPNYDDYNCKMCLFDSNGNYIQNPTNSNDSTISIHADVGLTQYESLGKLLITIQNAMNVYSNSFTPAANFSLTHNSITNKITITNKTGASFGIGFDFENINNMVSSGSLHYVLGFEQKSYINITSIESIKPSLSFENIFADDYMLFCSDISSNSNDINIIGIGNSDNIKSNDILFAIPFTSIKNFSPIDSAFYKIDISNSSFSLGYKNKTFNENNINMVNFYLRTLSGRCISSNCQWNALISFQF
jgi:hypothetical protein